MNKSFWWLIVVLIVVAIGGFYLRSDKTSTPDEETLTTEEQVIPATGNINDAVDAILGDLASEDLTPDESDSAIIGTDDTLLSGFDEAFDATQL